jgi:hypothetical protein
MMNPDIPQKAMKCRACDIMFACEYDDMKTIFCGCDSCPGVEKPQIDAEKLREWLEEKKSIYTKSANSFKPHSVQYDTWCNRLVPVNDLLDKLDAGDFDVQEKP